MTRSRTGFISRISSAVLAVFSVWISRAFSGDSAQSARAQRRALRLEAAGASGSERRMWRGAAAGMCALWLLSACVPSYAQSVFFAGAQTTVPASGLSHPTGVAVDGAGDVFIADSYNNRVVELPAGGGPQTTVGSGLYKPEDVAVDGAGDVFIADTGNNRVVELPAGGGPQTTVGSGLSEPLGLAVDGAGDVFIADSGNSRVVELPAGGGPQTTVLGGLGPYPAGVAVDGAGDVFIADTNNFQVVEVPAGGGAPTTVGSGLYFPEGLAVDGAGDLFVAVFVYSEVVEIAAGSGTQTTVPASGLGAPFGVAVDRTGDVFIADLGLNQVVEVQRVAVNFGSVNVCPGGQTTPAPCNQTLTLNYNVAVTTTFGTTKVVTQGAPNLDFTLSSGSTCTGTVSAGNTCTVNVTFAPLAPGLRMGAVQLTDSSGNLLVTTLVHGIGQGPAIALGPGAQTSVGSGLSNPYGAAVDAAGDVFIADTDNSRVVKVPAGGGAQTTVPASGLIYPSGVAVDGAGDVFIADFGLNQVVEVPAGGGAQITVGSGLSGPHGVAVDGTGDVFIADTYNSRVVKVPAGGGAQITLYQGNQPYGVAVDGAGDVFISDIVLTGVVEVPAGGGPQIIVGSGLAQPIGVAVDEAGDVFIADTANNRVVEVPAGGGAQTVVGSGLSDAFGVAVDGAGDVFVANSNQVVEVQRAQPPTLSFASTPVGSASSDSPQSVTIQNIGNQPLNAITPGLVVGGPNFLQVSGSGTPADCTSSFALTPGATCNLSISFEPQSVGPLTSTATFTDNALNASPSASQSIALQGTGTVQLAITSANNTTFTVGSAGSFTVTATGSPIPALTSSGSLPGGVTFHDNGNGTATLGGTPSTGGVFNIMLTAQNGAGSPAMQNFTLTVNKAASTIGMTSSPNPSTFGQTVTFTATVSGAGGGLPTGSVTFNDGANTIGTVALANGSASFPTSALAVGTHSVAATYAGDGNFLGTTSAATSQVVNLAPTATIVSPSANPAGINQSVTYTASVSSPYGVPVSGTLTFKDGAKTLATVSLSSPSYTTSYAATGTHSITAVYSGDSNDAGSTSSILSESITRIVTTSSISSNANPSSDGQPVTFTGTVSSSAGAPPNNEILSFKELHSGGETVLGTGTLNGGVATFSISTLSVGTHDIKVTYPGDSTLANSHSNPVVQVVNKSVTTTTLSSSPNPSAYGQAVGLVATVTSSAPGGPTGTVTFKNGAATLGTTILSGGNALLAATKLPVGTLTIAATYNGDAQSGKSSGTTTQTVNQATTTTAVSSSVNPSKKGQAVKFTATVTSLTIIPTGTVTFMDGSAVLGTGTLGGGKASYSTSTLSTGSHNITAVYNGTASIGGSTSPVLVQTVN